MLHAQLVPHKGHTNNTMHPTPPASAQSKCATTKSRTREAPHDTHGHPQVSTHTRQRGRRTQSRHAAPSTQAHRRGKHPHAQQAHPSNTRAHRCAQASTGQHAKAPQPAPHAHKRAYRCVESMKLKAADPRNQMREYQNARVRNAPRTICTHNTTSERAHDLTCLMWSSQTCDLPAASREKLVETYVELLGARATTSIGAPSQ